MRFKKNDDSYFELTAISYKPSILINFELVELSNSKFSSIDRGVLTDRYSTVLSFSNKTEYINSLISELNLLRDNLKPVLIDMFDERVFGDNVDHSGVVSCVINSLTPQASETINTQSVDIGFLPSAITYTGGSGIPAEVDCLQGGWKGYSRWKTHINETYQRDNYFVDREADVLVFEGSYIFTVDQNAEAFNFWKTQRGEPFSIEDGDFGVDNMFGSDGGNGTHIVIITNITYENISPTKRQTKIELVKVG